jgi:autotransporter-associated beta strand protein
MISRYLSNHRCLFFQSCCTIIFLLVSLQSQGQLTWSLAGGNASWPADKRTAIVNAMNAAVAVYNANGYFPKQLTANYNAGVPTAQASYSGWIDFGGQISTTTAIHEISHTLGVGQVAAWNSNRSGGVWTGARAKARIVLYDGAGAVIGCDSIHFWPYGMNYASEDSATNRIRHVRMVAAMRWDMGIVADSDGDGMPDDWEMFHFGNLSQVATGDFDVDGSTNLAEYNADTNASQAFSFTWNGGAGTWDSTSLRWSGAGTIWRNGGNDAANFASTAGAVAVTAGTTVNDLLVNSSGYSFTGSALTFTGGNPSVSVASGATATISSVVQGSAGLIKNGAGTLVLDGANTFTGPLTLNAGVLDFSSAARLYMSGGSDVTTIQGGAVLSFGGNWGWNGTMRYMGVRAEDTIIDSGTLRHKGNSNTKTADGAGRLFTIGAGGATLDSETAGQEFTIGYRYDYGSALVSEGGSLTLSGEGNGELNYNVPGTGALIKRGAGTWKLTGTANSYSGGTTIGVNTNSGTVGGILSINDSTSLGSGPVTIIAGNPAGTHQGAQLQLSGGITLTNPTWNISGLGYTSSVGVLRNVSGNNAIQGDVFLTGGAGGSVISSDAGKLTLADISCSYVLRTLEFTGAGNFDVTGTISNGTTVALPVTKSGSGQLTYLGNQSYSSGTVISAGVVQVGNNTTTGSLGTGAVNNAGIVRFHRSDDALLVPNIISGAGSVQCGVSTGGTLAAVTTLSGMNDFTGAITINSGGLRITRAQALGSGNKTITMTNGTNGNCRLLLDGSAAAIQIPSSVSYVISNQNITYPAIINEAGNNSIAGNISLTNGGGATRVRVDGGSLVLSGQITPAVTGRILMLDGVGQGTLSGGLKNAGSTVALEKHGNGIWELTGSAHSYTGTTTVMAGRLRIASSLSSKVIVQAGVLEIVGDLNQGADVELQSTGRLEIRVDDTWTVNQAVSVSGDLAIISTEPVARGQSRTIINKTSAGPIVGTFLGKSEGSSFVVDGLNWTITYQGGDGNDVVISTPPLSPIEQWRMTRFANYENVGDAADLADPDHDGIVNLLEYATNSHPNLANQSPGILDKQGAVMTFSYSPNAVATDVTYIVEWSDSLQSSWSTAGIVISQQGNLVTATIPATVGRRFVRLRVER